MASIKIDLISLKEINQNKLFFNHNFKFFIYNQLKNTSFSLSETHSKFKYLNFSPLHKITNRTIFKNHIYSVIVSSPYKSLILYLYANLQKNKVNLKNIDFETKERILIGEGEFGLVNIDIMDYRVEDNSILESTTPIICKANRENNNYVNFDNERELFLDILKRNLIKKYNYFYNKDLDSEYDLFKNVSIRGVYRKDGTSSIGVNVKNYNSNLKNHNLFILGNRLRISLEELSQVQKDILKIGLDSGFGGLNSYGMGFVRNLKPESYQELDYETLKKQALCELESKDIVN